MNKVREQLSQTAPDAACSICCARFVAATFRTPIQTGRLSAFAISEWYHRIRQPLPFLPFFVVCGGSSAATIACCSLSVLVATNTVSLASYLVEHILELELSQRRALDVLHRAELPCHPLTVLLPDRLHLLLGELVAHLWVVSQIGLSADDKTWHTGTVMVNFREPLFPYVLERCWRCD